MASFVFMAVVEKKLNYKLSLLSLHDLFAKQAKNCQDNIGTK